MAGGTISVTVNTRYDATNLTTSGRKLSRKKQSKMSPPQSAAALGRISQERFMRGSRNFIHLSGTVSLTKLRDLAGFGRLQYATKYCTQVRKIGAAGRVEYSAIV